MTEKTPKSDNSQHPHTSSLSIALVAWRLTQLWRHIHLDTEILLRRVFFSPDANECEDAGLLLQLAVSASFCPVSNMNKSKWVVEARTRHSLPAPPSISPHPASHTWSAMRPILAQ